LDKLTEEVVLQVIYKSFSVAVVSPQVHHRKSYYRIPTMPRFLNLFNRRRLHNQEALSSKSLRITGPFVIFSQLNSVRAENPLLNKLIQAMQ